MDEDITSPIDAVDPEAIAQDAQEIALGLWDRVLEFFEGLLRPWNAYQVVIVIGLMSAVGPVLRSDPASLIFWISLAFALNFGAQFVAYLILKSRPDAVPVSVIAGNRNIALFLVGLPASITDPVLIFIGCYQVPMYLTPLLMRRFYAHG